MALMAVTALGLCWTLLTIKSAPKNRIINITRPVAKSIIWVILNISLAPLWLPRATCSDTNLAIAVGKPAVARVKNKAYTG